MTEPDHVQECFDIAIISMVGRFPGAETVEDFWANIRDGVESIRAFTDEELLALGVSREIFNDPTYVKAGALIKDIDQFDAAFFGLNPREAAIMDPQQRIFLECASDALEKAGYSSDRTGEKITGVYAGTSLSTYLLFNLLANPDLVNSRDSFQVMIGNDKDFLSTRVAYHLNLRGPALDVQTGCSTSLVAVHLACQALLTYQCDMALAGGVSVHVPQDTGYFYQEGGITSPDGHCRAFDAQAQGTIFGSGVGVVVLKRLEDALADADVIQAVIKGSAVNNDGATKLGYTAPGVEGQAEVITRAHSIAGLTAQEVETIQYIETHGTGTALGDPIELVALTKAFSQNTQKRQYCALGSVKTNIGHLDAAAGIAGLIKTVLALQQKQIPPSLHFQQPNPHIDFANSPFYVNTSLSEWRTTPGAPRRAGVSSFGIGGTNAHVVLEEAPPMMPTTAPSRASHLLMLSARSPTALENLTERFTQYIRQHPTDHLPDVAFTLQVGRRSYQHRKMLVCQTIEEAGLVLERRDPQHILTAYQGNPPGPITFMFPGGGAQYISMGAGLYQSEATFRKHVDHCATLLLPRLGVNLCSLLYPTRNASSTRPESLMRPSVALPALFVIEYALAHLLLEWGIHPDAFVGHSLGEYTAACLSGVFSLEDALALVSLRGQLFEQLPAGAMIGVSLPEAKVHPLLKNTLSLAAVNGPEQCVIAGSVDDIEMLLLTLTHQQIDFRRIQIDTAAHSHLVAAILEPFGAFLKTLRLSPPRVPFLSNVSGTWITANEATDSHYWVKHLRQTVLFADNLKCLLETPARIFLEVGPGQTLSTLARPQMGPEQVVFSSMRHPHEKIADENALLLMLGKLWLRGISIDWSAFYMHERRRRVSLPTYPFERQRFWIDPATEQGVNRSSPTANPGKNSQIPQWFYVPSWKRTLLPVPDSARSFSGERWIVFLADDESGWSAGMLQKFVRAGAEVITVRRGAQYAQIDSTAFLIDPGEPADYDALLQAVSVEHPVRSLRGILHLWSYSDQLPDKSIEGFQQTQQTGFYSLLLLAQALMRSEQRETIQLEIVTNYLFDLRGNEPTSPEKAPLLALCKVFPQEYPFISCRCIDISLPEARVGKSEGISDLLFTELCEDANDLVVAYRGKQRWVQVFDQLSPQPAAPRLRKNGVYMLIGGLGNVGLLLAEHLTRTWNARLILTGRSSLPPRESWNDQPFLNAQEERIRQKVVRLRNLEAQGAEMLTLSVNVTDQEQVKQALDSAMERFGALDGVIYLAGVTGERAAGLIPDLQRLACEEQFQTKAHGLYLLAEALSEKALDFCALFSSNAAILGGPGLLAYSAANVFMDAFATTLNATSGIRWLTANWDRWLQPVETPGSIAYQSSLDHFATQPNESVQAFEHLLGLPTGGQVVISTGDLASRLYLWLTPSALKEQAERLYHSSSSSSHARPAISTSYIPPATDIEAIIAATWQTLLGIDQVGIYDNFFELGGNSLVGLRIIAQLKKELQIDIPVISLFEGPTIASLAQLIGQHQTVSDRTEVSRSRGERRREQRQSRAGKTR